MTPIGSHGCPVCGWRYKHAPECPLREAPAAAADRIFWIAIVLLCGWFYGLVAFTPGV